MKKTIAAILVTILASAGYIVLDKAAVEKIDTLASQVSSQQAVIDRYAAQADPLEMHTGSTLRCYPAEGTVVQAYVLDLSRTTTWTGDLSTTLTTKPIDIYYGTTRPETTTTTTTTTTTATTTKKHTTYPATTYGVHAQADDPTGPTVPSPTYPAETTVCEPTATTAPSTAYTTEAPTQTTTTTTVLEPTFYIPYDSDYDYYYHLRTDVRITRLHCDMVDKTLTGIPKYSIFFSGKVDPSFAGRQIRVCFGDHTTFADSAVTTILPDGSFFVTSETVLANSAVIPLREVRID